MRCKIGDLAVVVGGDFVENLGMILEIIGPGHKLEWWEVRIAGKPARVLNLKTNLPSWSSDYGGPVYCGDSILTPLRGLSQGERDRFATGITSDRLSEIKRQMLTG